jgi:phosphoglycolate phosphatase-like HAD superfamily hydrolase
MPLLRRRGVIQFLTGALGGPTSKAENLHKLMRSDQVRPHNILFVGDSRDDLEAARELGVRFVAVTAEKRISGRKPFAMRDRTGLIAVIDRLIARPRRGMRRILT